MSFVYFQVYYGNIFKRFLYSKTTHYINNKGNYAGKYVWLIIKVESFWEKPVYFTIEREKVSFDDRETSTHVRCLYLCH